jgi:hypothetical protein
MMRGFQGLYNIRSSQKRQILVFLPLTNRLIINDNTCFQVSIDSIRISSTGAGEKSTGAGILSTGTRKKSTGAGILSTGTQEKSTGTRKKSTGARKKMTGAGKKSTGTREKSTGAGNSINSPNSQFQIPNS